MRRTDDKGYVNWLDSQPDCKTIQIAKRIEAGDSVASVAKRFGVGKERVTDIAHQTVYDYQGIGTMYPDETCLRFVDLSGRAVGAAFRNKIFTVEGLKRYVSSGRTLDELKGVGIGIEEELKGVLYRY